MDHSDAPHHRKQELAHVGRLSFQKDAACSIEHTGDTVQYCRYLMS